MTRERRETPNNGRDTHTRAFKGDTGSHARPQPSRREREYTYNWMTTTVKNGNVQAKKRENAVNRGMTAERRMQGRPRVTRGPTHDVKQGAGTQIYGQLDDKDS